MISEGETPRTEVYATPRDDRFATPRTTGSHGSSEEWQSPRGSHYGNRYDDNDACYIYDIYLSVLSFLVV